MVSAKHNSFGATTRKDLRDVSLVLAKFVSTGSTHVDCATDLCAADFRSATEKPTRPGSNFELPGQPCRRRYFIGLPASVGCNAVLRDCLGETRTCGVEDNPAGHVKLLYLRRYLCRDLDGLLLIREHLNPGSFLDLGILPFLQKTQRPK